MNVLDIPFNKFLGLQRAEEKPEYLLKLRQKGEYLNHLGTLHASALFALAEASSGEFLLRQFNDLSFVIVPVVRKVDIRFNKPGIGSVFSTAGFLEGTAEEIRKDLTQKGRVLIKVKADILNSNEEIVMSAVFQWFVSQK